MEFKGSRDDCEEALEAMEFGEGTVVWVRPVLSAVRADYTPDAGVDNLFPST